MSSSSGRVPRIAGLAVLTLCGGLLGVLFIHNIARSLRIETQGILTPVVVTSCVGRSGVGVARYDYRYEYRTGDRTYLGRDTTSAPCPGPFGPVISAYVDPANPAQSLLLGGASFSRWMQAGSLALTLVFTLCTLVALLHLVYPNNAVLRSLAARIGSRDARRR